MIERKLEAVSLWNVCECGRVLHSISEGKRGLCGSCWIKGMPQDTKAALNRLVSAAFKSNGSTNQDNLINDAVRLVRRDAEVTR